MADQTPASPVTDWRGTPITEGALVVYGAPVGRSIALVEGTVDGFTKSGRVNVRVLRRAYGGGWSDRRVVHVGPDRLTIVAALPPSDLPLLPDEIDQREAERAERQRVRDTHDFPEPYMEEFTDASIFRGFTARRWVHPVCTRCGHEQTYHITEECPGA